MTVNDAINDLNFCREFTEELDTIFDGMEFEKLEDNDPVIIRAERAARLMLVLQNYEKILKNADLK